MKMVSKFAGLMLWFFMGSTALSAQRPAYLKLEFDKNQKPFVFYPVVKGDTQEELCKNFGCSQADLRSKNHLSTGQNLTFGTTLQVPVSPDKIIKKNLKGRYDNLLPLYYTIKKGETAYRIVKVNLKDDLNGFYERNKIENNQLKVGAEVLVGWIDLRSAKEKSNQVLSQNVSKTDVKSGARVVVVKNKVSSDDEPTVFKKVVSEKKILTKEEETKEDQIVDANESSEVWVNDKGVAYWQHGHRSNAHKYVLHNTAAINSIIELYNPMLKRTVRAKVIGRIPDETYRNDIDIVLSEGAAESLGALDSRFQVEMRYKK
ncbi:MAG: LysM peptidoglycan-binding domain-containing protein [Saprospiraceae bacterium]